MEYKLVVRWKGSEKDLKAQARKLLKENNEAKRFVYATRPPNHGGPRASIMVPADFLSGKNSTALGLGQGVVLLPRHFFTPEPEVAVEDLSALAAKSRQGVSIRRQKGESGKIAQILLHAPYVLESIRRRVEDGSYGRHLAQIEEWQSSLSEPQDESIGPMPELRLKLRTEAVLEKDWWDIQMQFEDHGSDPAALEARIKARFEASCGEPLSLRDYQRLLRERAISLVLQDLQENPEKLSDYLRKLPDPIKKLEYEWTQNRAEMQAQDASKPDVSAGSSAAEPIPRTPGFTEQVAAFISIMEGMTSEGKASHVPSAMSKDRPQSRLFVADWLKQLHPLLLRELMQRRPTKTPDFSADLANILKQLDADYLIRSLDSKTRKRLDADAEEWAKKCEKVILAEYWPGGELHLEEVKKLVSKENPKSFDQNKDEATSICHDLLMRFGSVPRFAMRRLVENMQRCALRGLTPVPLAVESADSILRRWRSLLRSKLNFALAQLGEKQGKTTGSEVLDRPNQSGKKKSRTGESKDAAQESGGPKIHPDAQISKGLFMGDELEFNDEVRTIRDLLKSPDWPSEKDLKTFYELVHEIELAAWDAAMEELDQAEPKAGWTQRTPKARSRCLAEKPAPGRPSKTLLKDLDSIFSRR
jgi:hypothetical protein